jgi:hypothetical protein
MIQYADVIVDLQAGDTGKGKVAHHLAKQSNELDIMGVVTPDTPFTITIRSLLPIIYLLG